MVRERIADDIYVFTSRRYAQVTAGAILTKEGVILIDTLFYPDETREIKNFLEDRLGLTIRYIINSHYHADHTLGTCMFPKAQVISHARCRELLDTSGREGLEQMKAQSNEFDGVEIVLPDMVFDEGQMIVHLGGKSLRLSHCPGHSPDLISTYILNDQILFASDNVMPVPTIFDGDLEHLSKSLTNMMDMKLDALVQGHGEVVLRGEVQELLESDLAYLSLINKLVKEAVDRAEPEATLQHITIESCGKSRIPLNGFVSDLHQANLRRLYHNFNRNN